MVRTFLATRSPPVGSIPIYSAGSYMGRVNIAQSIRAAIRDAFAVFVRIDGKMQPGILNAFL